MCYHIIGRKTPFGPDWTYHGWYFLHERGTDWEFMAQPGIPLDGCYPRGVLKLDLPSAHRFL